MKNETRENDATHLNAAPHETPSAAPRELPASTRANVEVAARAIEDADALLFTAGAGIGVDSGLPDFRGDEGFWNAYPPLRELNISFAQMANPRWFFTDPTLAWGFYGHRQNLYRDTQPHDGFQVLRKWAAQKNGGAFVYTSNVDEQFRKAGFEEDQIVECHGSIHHLQCAAPCCDEVWHAGELKIEVDEITFRATGELPRCPRCGGVARSNILMFGDGAWLENRTSAQEKRETDWLKELKNARLCIIECGAGTAIPSVRCHGERLASTRGATLVRINVREAGNGSAGTISIALGAREALRVTDVALVR